ncbi:unannotated protein [freshwater metagenome]|uniref:Unannotated protein n=1 Tax=freshwater metagenome TaxID=449393 RepID=A0A6J6Q750_9ZZZZ
MVFGFRAEQRLVWIDSASPDQASRTRSGALCKEHADRLTAPMGWHLDDRRQAVPQLFRTPSDDDATGALERKARRPKVPAPAPASDQTLQLFNVDDTGTEPPSQ